MTIDSTACGDTLTTAMSIDSGATITIRTDRWPTIRLALVMGTDGQAVKLTPKEARTLGTYLLCAGQRENER